MYRKACSQAKMVLCDTGAQDDMGAQAPKCQGEAAFACRSATRRGVSAMLRQRVLPVIQLTGRASEHVSNRQKPRQEKGRFPTFCEAFAFSGDALEGPGGPPGNLRGNVQGLPSVYVIGTHSLTCYSVTGPALMKSKLTLRLDEDLKERAKRLANRRGTSVSKIVEDYFELLLEGSSEASAEETPSGGDRSGGASSGALPGAASAETGLSPRIQRLRQKLGKPAPEVEMDGDTRRWVEAAAEKHA